MSDIRYRAYPRTEPPSPHAVATVEVFRAHESAISTNRLEKGLTSDGVLAVLRPDLLSLGWNVESGKRPEQKIHRPVFFGDDGVPTLRYEVDAYHPEWRFGMEVEAGRGLMGNAVYRDLIQAMVMVQVDTLILAVANSYKYRSSGRDAISPDYDRTVHVANALYGHSRIRMPYSLVVVGY